MRPANDNRATRLRDPALNTLHRLERRCRRRGIPEPDSVVMGDAPVKVRFWHGIRLLAILPDGELIQRTSDEYGYTDPHADAQYERLFFVELELARAHRRRYEIDDAHSSLARARRYRRRAEGVVPPLMEAAE